MVSDIVGEKWLRPLKVLMYIVYKYIYMYESREINEEKRYLSKVA